MEQNLGTGLSAKCVLIPGKLCKSNIKDDNYINKIVEMPIDDIHMKKILLNEILISKLIKKRGLKNKKSMEWIESHFAIIEDVCQLREFKKAIIKKCELDVNLKDNYFIYVIKNAGCRPLKIGTKVELFDGSSGIIEEYSEESIKIQQKKNIKEVTIDEIKSGCGDFSTRSVLDIIKSEKMEFVKSSFLKLLKSIQFLHSIDIVHCDIKHPNIIMDRDKNVRIVDFGSSINMKDLINKEFEEFCENLPLIFSSKKVSKLIKESFRDISTTRKKMHIVETMQTTLTEKIGAMTMMYVPPEIVIANHLTSSKEHILENVMNFCKLSSKYEKDIEKLIDKKHKIIGDLFCKKNPAILKYDVYSLGIFFYYIVSSCNIENKDLNDLILKMININYESRITIDECISHKFFK